MKFPSRFLRMDEESVTRLVREFGSPVYVIDITGLTDRFESFQRTARQLYANSQVAISYKTNPTAALLLKLHQFSEFAEVVSKPEFDLAKRLGVAACKIVFNGPAKNDGVLRDAILGGSQINCDHFDEIKRIEKIATSENLVAKVGLRLSLPTKGHFSRFGFSTDEPLDRSEAATIARYVVDSKSLSLGGLHSQIGTNVRDLDLFRHQGACLATFAEFLKSIFGVELSWINVGGGLASIAPAAETDDATPLELPDVGDYCKAVYGALKDYLSNCKNDPVLFFEPGRTIFGPFGATLTTVLGIRPSAHNRNAAVICDAGVTAIPLSSQFDFPVHVPSRKSSMETYDFCGPTCMQRDQLANSRTVPKLEVGDSILFYGTGGYNIALANSFINYRPGIVGWDAAGHFKWLRKPETFDSMKDLHIADFIE